MNKKHILSNKISDLGSCEGNNHCHIMHNGKEKCIPHIEDCQNHWKLCSDGCHSECKCQKS